MIKPGTVVRLSAHGVALRVTEMAWWQGVVVNVDLRKGRALVTWPPEVEDGNIIKERRWWEWLENITAV